MTPENLDGNKILGKFKIFEGGTGGLDSWLRADTPTEVFDALGELEKYSLTQSRLNQLLTLAHEAPISKPLFHYYWLSAPQDHPYDVRKVPVFDDQWIGLESIGSLDQLYWGLYRFYVDALLFFGNIRTAYQRLRQLSDDGLYQFFERRHFDTPGLRKRGSPLAPVPIRKDNRYLISEMACKSFDVTDVPQGELGRVLITLYREHCDAGGGPVTAKQLLTGAYQNGKFSDRQLQFDLSADDFLEEVIHDEAALLGKIERVAREFERARARALKNTELYLSMLGDLDVYVATSMRDRNDFRAMAEFCDDVFADPVLQDLNLRYFDPTLSAAENHEDKGLIECLMVKCAKALVLYAGTRDSYGKDAEAAMALSLGKPVIIHADEEYRSRFFKDIHPLSRLIDFQSGVAIGAMVATSPSQVIELLRRTFSNELEYELVQPRPKYLVLKEKITGSVVRLQTGNDLLRETFWNYYHNDIR
jgi:hypothetical protein